MQQDDAETEDAAPGLRKVLAAGAIGNVLEWFDFAIYGYLAQYISTQFFPSSNPLSALLAVYGAFAAGYLARPVGAMVFGHLGDTIGRKHILVLSIVMMGCSTAAIGFLPTYDQIGPIAGVLLVLLRVCQGISVGGEFTGSMVFIAEHAPPRQRGLLTSVTNVGGVAGFLAGSALAAVMANIFSEEQINDTMWRFAFMSGIVIMVIGLLLRRSLTVPETVDRGEREMSPVVAAFRLHWRDLLRVAGLALPANVGFYIMFVFAVSYLTDEMHVSTARAMDINTFALVVMMFVVPLGGWLGDVWGRKRTLFVINFALLIAAYPLFALMHHSATSMILLGQLGFTLIIGLLFGANPATLVEISPKSVRVSVLSIGYSLALALFGGTAPAVATYLVERTSDDMAPAFYIMVFAVVAMVAVLSIKDRTTEEI